jgi:hypothetical protein
MLPSSGTVTLPIAVRVIKSGRLGWPAVCQLCTQHSIPKIRLELTI